MYNLITLSKYIKNLTINHILFELRYNYLNRESGKIGKYTNIGNEILPPDQGTIIQQAKFTNLSLGKVFEKQAKTVRRKRRKIDLINCT